MAIEDERLGRIVGLKRQAAENQFRSLSLRMRKLDNQILENETALAATHDGIDTAFVGDLLAAERFTQKLLREIRELTVQRAALFQELERARFELQKILVSEDVLSQE